MCPPVSEDRLGWWKPEVFQECSKSLRNWQKRGCFLSESRSPELMEGYEKEGKG